MCIRDRIQVEAYGQSMHINQVATVSVPEPRLLSVQVWDKSMVGPVEKAIRESSLGLNPQTEGQVIRLRIPELTQDRRKEMVKVAHKYAEGARVAVRHIRRDGMDVLKAKEKDPEPTLNLSERIGVARLVRQEACLAIQGKGFKGQVQGAAFKGRLRYMDVDRWKPVKVADHPYDVAECDLCVRECPVKGAISIETVFAPDGTKRKSPVVHEPCVGCGVCEMICPVEPTCIVIDAREVWNT